MVGDILQPTHLLLVLLVALVVLGPKRLPEVARKLGDGMRDFKAAISFDSDKGDGGRPREEIANPRHEIAGSYPPEPEPVLEPEPKPASAPKAPEHQVASPRTESRD